jgi:hypothetical protein
MAQKRLGRVCAAGLLLLVPGVGFDRGHLARLGLVFVVAFDAGAQLRPRLDCSSSDCTTRSVTRWPVSVDTVMAFTVSSIQGWLTRARSAIGYRTHVPTC